MKKYRSLLLLPTYLSPDSEIDPATIVTGEQMGSRRSLRKKQNGEANLFDGKATTTNVTSNPVRSDEEDAATAAGYLSDDSEKCTVYDEDERLSSRFVCDETLALSGSQDRMLMLANTVSFAQLSNKYKQSLEDDTPAVDVEANRAPVRRVPEIKTQIVATPNNHDAADNSALRLASSGNHLTVNNNVNGGMLLSNGNGRKQATAAPPALTHKNQLQHSIKNTNYLRNIRFHRNSIHYRGAVLTTHRYRLRTSSCPNIYRNSMTTLAQDCESTWRDSVVEVLKSVFDLSLFLNPKFAYFQFSTLLLFVW